MCQFTVTIGCLVLHQRYKRRVENYLSLTKELSSESVATRDTVINDGERNAFIRNDSDAEHQAQLQQQETTRNRLRSTGSTQNAEDMLPCTNGGQTTSDIEDLCKNMMDNGKPLHTNELCSTSFACSGPSRQQCHELVRDYNQRQQLEFMEFYNSIQSLRHTVLLILLLCSMFVVSWDDRNHIFDSMLNENLFLLFALVDLTVGVDIDYGRNVGHLY